MEKILVLDFGGQYNQLIARRVREQRVFAEVRGFDKITLDEILAALEADGRFDMGRIYVTGQSLGSRASIQLAQTRGDKIAAIISSCFLTLV